MKRVDNIRDVDVGGESHGLLAYPVTPKRKRTDLEQHFVVPWEMTVVKKKTKQPIISSEQVAYF
jgi:hypothetical protein